jgi:DNA-binding transcriptional LysR family regulator
MDAADAVVADFTSAPVGSLSIAAPVPFGLMFISPRVARFKALHPSLEITLDLNDQPLNLVEGNIDVAIRLGHLKTQGFAARKLGESPFLTVASPAYLQARGLPEKLADLSTHHCISYSNLDKPLEWTFISNGVRRDITVSSHYRSNNLLAIKDAAMAGLGIAQLPLWMVESEIKAGLLRPLLEKFPLPGFDIHAVFPTSKQIPRKVRLFVDFIKDELGTVSHLLGTRR